MRIIYIGQLKDGQTSLQRMVAIRSMGNEVYPINTYYKNTIANYLLNSYNKISRRLFNLGLGNFKSFDLAKVNVRLLSAIDKYTTDIIWIDKGLMVERNVLIKIKEMQPNCCIVGYSPDDMSGRHNQSLQFIDHISMYDCYFTTKTFGVKELMSLGCTRVEFIGNAYDENVHFPICVDKETKKKFGGGVGFIGAYEDQRAESILNICKAGIPVRVWGDNWHKFNKTHKNLIIEDKALWGLDYTRAICSFDINLCFLRKLNRDLQTTRSIEIPACGSFMLGERTPEHLELFEEGKEAEFFSSDEEMLEKIVYYINNPNHREKIAKMGRERCLSSGYSNHDRMKKILKYVECLDKQ